MDQADRGRKDKVSFINLLWLGSVIYTFVGLGLFHRSLGKELEEVRLDTEF